jgi:transposase
MRKQRTHYDKTFKDNAVTLSLERKNVSELAHELGISPTLFIAGAKSTKSEGKPVFPTMESALVKEKPEGL